jgi:hypothetical protein
LRKRAPRKKMRMRVFDLTHNRAGHGKEMSAIAIAILSSIRGVREQQFREQMCLTRKRTGE